MIIVVGRRSTSFGFDLLQTPNLTWHFGPQSFAKVVIFGSAVAVGQKLQSELSRMLALL
jgi:hypothetical protein